MEERSTLREQLHVEKIKSSVLVEALTSDFLSDLDAVRHLANSGLDVFAHNIEA